MIATAFSFYLLKMPRLVYFYMLHTCRRACRTHLVIVHRDLQHLGGLSVLKDEDTLAALIVLPRVSRHVLRLPFDLYLTVSAVHPLYGDLSLAATLFEQQTGFAELKGARFWGRERGKLVCVETVECIFKHYL